MDTISLYQWNLSYIVFGFTGGKQRITNQSLFLCKWGAFLSFYTLHTSAMFLTLASLDRACLLWSRWYKLKIARARIALVICIIILLILFGLNGFYDKAQYFAYLIIVHPPGHDYEIVIIVNDDIIATKARSIIDVGRNSFPVIVCVCPP